MTRQQKSATAKPDELLTTTPKKVGTSPRRKPNPLAVWHPEGSGCLARKRRASREPTLKPTHAMSVIGKSGASDRQNLVGSDRRTWG